MIERYLEYNNNCSKVINSSRAWNADPVEHFGYRSIFKLSYINGLGRKLKCCIWKDKIGGYSTNNLRRSLVFK